MMDVRMSAMTVILVAAVVLSPCANAQTNDREVLRLDEAISLARHRIADTDHLADLGGLPREIIVVGAGVVGLECASFMAALGADVTLIDQRAVVLEFVDRQIIEALSYHLRELGVTFRLAEKVTHIRIDPVRDRIFAQLESGKKVQGQALVYAVGRQANGDQLHLEAGLNKL